MHGDFAELGGRMDRLESRMERVESRLNLSDPRHCHRARQAAP